MADAIFISYRRDDSEGEAGRLFDDLARAFGNDAVFMDVAGIKPGVDFRQAIEQNVASCGVLLAIIGPAWLTAANHDGKRRLDDPGDFVALEIASALRRAVPVIPVLVHAAMMPSADHLPESIANLAYHNSVEISHARWSSDVALLIEALKTYVTPNPARQSEPSAAVQATAPAQLLAPHPTAGTMPPPPVKSRASLIVGAILAIGVVLGAAVHEVVKSKSSAAKVEPSSVPVAVPVAMPVAVPATNPVKEAAAATAVPARQSNDAAAAGKSSPNPAVTAPPASHGPPRNSGVAGTWKLLGGPVGGDTLSVLVIVTSGAVTTIHAFGSCSGAPCDWGTQPATAHGGEFTATFSPRPGRSDTARTATITARLVPEGLGVTVQNTFQNPSGTRQNGAHRIFVPAT